MSRAEDAKRWAMVVLFAMAMAWVEAAVVFYLRTLVGRIDPYQINPLPAQGRLDGVELLREAATLIMLACVGGLAGTTGRLRLAYAALAFGVWDIGYYIFLKQMTGWPGSLLAWDVLFLIPLPWWGPVIAPISIAVLLIIGGTLVSQFREYEQPIWPGRLTVFLNLIGAMLCLFVFMSDAIGVASKGPEAIRKALPTQFNWQLFALAWLLMSLPILEMAKRLSRQLGTERPPQP
jgi:hypothetical protein